jgi:peptidoglycan/LPS O-acetylase OafA/YrhL
MVGRFPLILAPRLKEQFTRLGDPGVRVFFVLSGFLITSMLWHEIENTGTISLRRFYVRRALRIVPAFLVFLALRRNVNG